MTYLPTVVLLLISNTFMTFAWYGHLKFEQVPLWKVILVSWGIAFLEYVFQVPANRIGNMAGTLDGAHLVNLTVTDLSGRPQYLVDDPYVPLHELV